MTFRGFAVSTCFLLLASSITATAAPVIVDATDGGHYNSAGFHNPNNRNHITGIFGTEHRSFFVFDLSSVTGNINSATLRLFNPFVSQFQPGYSSPDPTETLNIYDVTTSAADIAGNLAGVAGFADLGSGTLYGSLVMSPADNGKVVEITLNAAALQSIRTTSTLFVLGGALGTLGTGNQFVFGHSMADFVPDHTRQLVLDVTSASVPEPASFGLAGAGAILLLVLRKRGCLI